MPGLQHGQGFVPETAVVDEMRHVEAEAVHAVRPAVRIGAEEAEPEVVDLDHLLAQSGVRVVELGGVRPIRVVEDLAFLVLHIEFRP